MKIDKNNVKYASPKQTIKLVPFVLFVNFVIIIIGLWISGTSIDLWYLIKLYFICVGVVMTATAIRYVVKDRD